MKRSILLLVILLLCSFLSYAQEKPTIAVLDFKYSGIPKIEAEVFLDFITSNIVQTGAYTVIDKAQRRNLLEEMEFSNADCADEQCQLEIGRLLAANQIIVGSLGKVSNRYVLNIKLIEVETAKTLNTASKLYNSMDDLIDDSASLVIAFVGAKGPAIEEAAAEATAAGEPTTREKTVIEEPEASDSVVGTPVAPEIELLDPLGIGLLTALTKLGQFGAFTVASFATWGSFGPPTLLINLCFAPQFGYFLAKDYVAGSVLTAVGTMFLN